MNILDKFRDPFATQLAYLTVVWGFYPSLSYSLYQRAQIINSIKPNDLTHSDFFKDKRNFYRGLSMNLGICPILYPLVDAALINSLRKIQEFKQRPPNPLEKIVVGFGIGMSSVIVCNPLEVAILISQKYKFGPINSCKKILKIAGIRGFYTGTSVMALRNGSFVGTTLVMTPEIEKKINPWTPGNGNTHDFISMLIASLFPALLHTCISAPIELPMVMVQSDPEKSAYRSANQAFRAAYQKHGIKVIKAGLTWKLVATAIEMTGLNFFKKHYLNTIFTQGES